MLIDICLGAECF